MHRRPLLGLLAAYAGRFPAEVETVTRFIRFVESRPECFERSLAEGHITGSAWILDRHGAQALLTHHRKLDRWLQLGGHADGDPDVLRVALREAVEESGLDSFEPVSTQIFDLDIHPIPARPGEPEHLHYDVRFALRHSGHGAFTVSDESHDLAWVPLADLPAYSREESLLRMARKSPAPSPAQRSP